MMSAMGSTTTTSPRRPVVEDMVVHFDYDDNNLKQYFIPGEVLKGRISLHLRSEIRVRRIVVSLKGSAQLSWEIPHKKRTYTANEEYFNVSRAILDGIYDRTVNLGRGSHEFFFNHLLPDTIPSSFKGVYGSVTYVLKVELEADNTHSNTVITEPFLVFRRPPLPRETFVPIESKTSKRFYNCCSSGKVKVKAGLTRWGGIPGESLYVNAQVINYTDREIMKVVASVVMTSVYYAKSDTITFRQIISQREDEHRFHNRHGRRWRTVKLDVPPYIPDTDLVGCSIMDVTYSFHFKVEIDGYDLHLETPIKVGGHPHGRFPEADVASLFSSARDVRLNRWSMDTHSDEGFMSNG